MKHSIYEAPSTRVIELQQQQELLTGSPLTGDRGNPYGDPDSPEGW